MGFTDLNNGGQPTGSGYGPVPTPIYKFLTLDGDGVTKNANGDYSATGLGEKCFYIQPPAGQIYRITRMMILVRDVKNGFQPDHYGSIGELTAGIQVKVTGGINQDVLIDLTDGLPVNTNGNWGKFCFDAEILQSELGTDDSYLRARWTFERSGYPIRLVGDNSERLGVFLNDDLSGLVEHHFHVQGYIEGTA